MSDTTKMFLDVSKMEAILAETKKAGYETVGLWVNRDGKVTGVKGQKPDGKLIFSEVGNIRTFQKKPAVASAPLE